MEKFIELLNEYSETAVESKCNWTDLYDEDGVYFLNLSDRDMTIEEEEVISKKFGFIKWLVENDKIDLDKLEKKVLKENIIRKFDEGLLMLLSISDNPIEDLILYLK